MPRIKLNRPSSDGSEVHEYELDASKKYVIDMTSELDQQMSILQSVQVMGLPAIADYHNWLSKNGFNVNNPNPTNDFVSQFYGVKPLWKTDLSQGIVVKENSDDGDYYIVMECNKFNAGFKHTQMVLTLGGCL